MVKFDSNDQRLKNYDGGAIEVTGLDGFL